MSVGTTVASSGEEFLGLAKIDLDLLEDRPPRDLQYNLQARINGEAFDASGDKSAMQGAVFLRVQYGSRIPTTAVGDEEAYFEKSKFKKSAHALDRKRGMMTHFMKEIETLRQHEAQLQKTIGRMGPKLHEATAQLARREEAISAVNGGQGFLASLHRLENDNNLLTEAVAGAKAVSAEKDVAIRRLERRIMQLEKMNEQKQRVARRLSSHQLDPNDMETVVRSVMNPAALTLNLSQLHTAVPQIPENTTANNDTDNTNSGSDSDSDSNSNTSDTNHTKNTADPTTETTAQNASQARHVLKWRIKYKRAKAQLRKTRERLKDTEAMHAAAVEQMRTNAIVAVSPAPLHPSRAAAWEREREQLTNTHQEDQLKIQEFQMQMGMLESQLDEVMSKYKKEARERKRLYNQLQEIKGNIRVYCRCRPLTPAEMRASNTDIISFGDLQDITVTTDQLTKTFEFDACFDQDSSQEQVFVDTRPLMQSVLDGFNVCIFAYGQTGSGKTYTMQGTQTNPGVNIRALEELFQLATEKGADYQFVTTISVMEVYCEQIRDLLSSKSDRLQIKQEVRGVRLVNYVEGLTQTVVENVDQAIEVINLAANQRATAATDCNEHSSRSHLILTVDVSTKDRLSDKQTQASLHLVDLAGSERVSKSHVTKQQLEETKAINLSLSALGSVLAALRNQQKHVPYRDSKLTHVLADALGGNSKVLMFCNVSPASSNMQETLSSLNFASRARAVELGKATANNNPTANGNSSTTSNLSLPVELVGLESPHPANVANTTNPRVSRMATLQKQQSLKSAPASNAESFGAVKARLVRMGSTGKTVQPIGKRLLDRGAQ